MVQKISDKFGLNRNEVQKVFDDAKAEQMAKMETKQLDRLDALVKQGKITEAQKTLILNKQKEHKADKQSKIQDFKNLNPEQRKVQIDKEKADLNKWAKENGIDPAYLFQGFEMRVHHGQKLGM